MDLEEDLPLDQYTTEPTEIPQSRSEIRAAKVLGIISIITSFVCFIIYGLPGLITGIIGLVLANQNMKRHEKAEIVLSVDDIATLKQAKTFSIVGIVISSLVLLVMIGFVIFVTSDVMHPRY